MLIRVFPLFVSLFLSVSGLFAQRLNRADRTLMDNLKTHVAYLSDDKLQGRRTGTTGEKLAMNYISKQFQKAGLRPMGSDGTWFQEFEVYDGKQVNPASHLIINGHDLKLNEDYFPLAYSPNAHAEAAVAMVLQEEDVPWFLDIKSLIDESSGNPHFDLYEAIKERAAQAAEKNATALILYNSHTSGDELKFNERDRSEPSRIPVFYMRKAAYKKFLSDESAMLDIKLKSDIGPRYRKGYNVIGYIDNGAAETVVLGAHYDHLGMGEDGNSRDTAKLIHNGADDNASGTAALIELARTLKQQKKPGLNYLFIAFSGEELGLFGSKYFVDNPTIDLGKINYMINMDMIGRLNENNSLTIGGFGTTPVWGSLLPSLKEARNFTIKFDSSGTGPSDHTSFYRKNIPVLFFFTGLHTDYHKPSDDHDKVNYTGQTRIVNYIRELIEKSAASGKLTFTPTREQQTTTSARFSVSLGIMPDYTFSGPGVKADGVSPGRAAEKAGINTGDIILQIGDYPISSMEAYMQALSKFKKGDETKVKYKRGEEIREADIRF